MLLSDDMVVVTCDNECSIWKGSKCIRHILSIDRRRIRATAIQDNLIFMVTDGESLVSKSLDMSLLAYPTVRVMF